MNHSEWKDLLSQNVGIEELTCESSSFGDAELGLLSSPYIGATENRSWLLPALRCLRIQDIDISWESVVKLQAKRGALGKEGVPPLAILCIK